LAISKDDAEFLVVELKRDQASDVVVGQIQRYMGWVKRNLCQPNQAVKGCIIAYDKDDRITDALYVAPDVSFVRYEVDFRLVGDHVCGQSR
jgi:restriction system protein